MIVEYHRPNSMEVALELLARKKTMTIPLGGGGVISRHAPENCAVVDLQNLGLDRIELASSELLIGATVKLQTLVEYTGLYTGLREAVLKSASRNQREMATLAGYLVTATGRSVLATALLAFGAGLLWQPGERFVSLDQYYAGERVGYQHMLITQIKLPTVDDFRLEVVARTPLDLPLVCIAIAKNNGAYRIAVGGFGSVPTLAYTGADVVAAADSTAVAFSAAEDAFASAVYRGNAARVLAARMLADLSA